MDINKDSEIKVKQLQNNGHIVWSISRLNTFNECPYQYYLNYIARESGKSNCYSMAGTAVHDWLEDIQNGKLKASELPAKLEGLLMVMELQGVNFPSQSIEDNWVNDMVHFAKTFKPLKGRSTTELLLVDEILPNIYMRGYVDLVLETENDELAILDWKTSSMFTGKRLTEAGRQLILYQMMYENVFDRKVDKIGWYMLKYADVYYKGRSKVCSRRSWVKERAGMVQRELQELGYDNSTIDLMLEIAIKNNNLDNMPEEVQNKFRIEPHIKWYSPTEKRKQEVLNYIETTVSKINTESHWDAKWDKFFCNNLCDFREKCEHNIKRSQ